jgi:hypothetical protein
MQNGPDQDSRNDWLVHAETYHFLHDKSANSTLPIPLQAAREFAAWNRDLILLL